MEDKKALEKQLKKIDCVCKTKTIKALDIIFLIILVLSVALFFVFIPKSKGAYANVYTDGKLVATISLQNESETIIKFGNGHNVVVVKDGKIYVKEATCHDGHCVNFGKKNKNGQQIVCLPNKMVIKIVNDKEEGVDGEVRKCRRLKELFQLQPLQV